MHSESPPSNHTSVHSGTDAPERKLYAKPSEWAPHKETIKMLYLDQNKTLEDVRHIMSAEHQFNATTSMYKKRIAAWGFGKKLKEDEVLELFHRKAQKDAAGKGSATLVVRGQVITAKRLRRYVRCHPETLAQLKAASNEIFSKVSSHRTHHPRGVPDALASPPTFRTMEHAMTSMRDYIRACMQGPDPRWKCESDGSIHQSRKLPESDSLGSSMVDVIGCFYLMHASIDNCSPAPVVFRFVDSSLNALSAAIKDQSPELLFQIIELLVYPWTGHPILFRIWREQVQALCEVLLGTEHPVTLIWRHLSHGEGEQSHTLAMEILNMLLREVESSRGPNHVATGLALESLLRISVSSGINGARRRYQRWLAAHPRQHDSRMWHYGIELRLAIYECNWHLRHAQFGEAQRAYQVISDFRRSFRVSPFDKIDELFLTNLEARVASGLGDSGNAERNFRRSLTLARSCPSLTNLELEPLLGLQALYKAANRHGDFIEATKGLRTLEQRLLSESWTGPQDEFRAMGLPRSLQDTDTEEKPMAGLTFGPLRAFQACFADHITGLLSPPEAVSPEELHLADVTHLTESSPSVMFPRNTDIP